MYPIRIKADPRFFQMVFLGLFLGYGLLFLNWDRDLLFYGLFIATCLVVQYGADTWVRRSWILPGHVWTGWRSALVTGLGLCFLLKTNDWYICLLAASLSVLSKFLIRVRGKHLFNPSAFGITATILLTGRAWLSPGQWGNNLPMVFLVCCLGCIVVTRVQKLDTSLAFLLTFSGLLLFRQVFFLHWPLDFFFKSISNGSLLIFSFFMISDPKTAPDHPMVRIAWAISIAGVAFYLSAFEWMYNTPIWTLVCAAPLVPILDHLFRFRRFEWSSPIRKQKINHQKSIV